MNNKQLCGLKVYDSPRMVITLVEPDCLTDSVDRDEPVIGDIWDE